MHRKLWRNPFLEVKAFIHKRTNVLEMMEEFRWKEISKMKEQMREKPGEWRYKFAFLRQKEKKLTDVFFGRKESKITEVWTPYVANRLQIPPLEETLIRRGKKVLLQRSPEGGIGLVDVHKKTTRIKQFRLSEAIVHSYFTDIRFVTLVCLLIGFSAWWVIAPEQLFESPKYAFSGEVAQLVRDTFIENICRIA
jgi:hypothetical protein